MKYLFISILSFLSVVTHSQQLSQVTFNQGATLSYFSFSTEQGVLIRISDEGKILEWGTEVMSDRYNYYAPRLQPFMGRVEYYGAKDDSVFRGKVKSEAGNYVGFYENVYKAIIGEAELEVKPEQARNVIRVIELAMQSHKERCRIEFS